VVLAACGDAGTTDPPPADPPKVTAVSPTLGSDVGLLQDLTVTFSAAMDPATLSEQTVTISPMGGRLLMRYDESARQLWIAPDSIFPPATSLALSITDGARGTSGTALEPYLASFTTGPLECAYLKDRFEPNDEASTAVDVPLDSLVVGLSTCGEDRDYFRVTLTEAASLTAWTHMTYADDLGWRIGWYREDGEHYATSEALVGSAMDAAYAHSFLPGSYLVRVMGVGDEPLALYDLRLETGAPCTDDPYEDNDFPDEAAAVEAGTLVGIVGCHRDADWFAVPVTAGQAITLAIDPGEYLGTRHLEIREPGGGKVDVTGGSTLGWLALKAKADGIALVQAEFWQDIGAYDLSIGVAAADVTDRLAFVSLAPGSPAEIHLMDSDGSNRVRLTDNDGRDLAPHWSPDGSRIAFQSDRDGAYDIYVMDEDGSNPLRLTDDAARDMKPAWSPDGGRIAFMSDRDGDVEVYVMDADGSDPKRLTDSPDYDGDPAWSPDGTKLAFQSRRDGNYEIYVMDADGSNPTRLTSDDAIDQGAAWSPDGAKIAFGTDRGSDEQEIWVMDPDGSNPTRVTAKEDATYGDFSPDWSPDGQKIAFARYVGGSSEIYIVHRDGSNLTRLTFGPSNSHDPAWKPH
jgi:hypothetical protein